METRARYILVGLFVLVAGMAGFGFVYWLHATGGLGARAVYRVRFEDSISGLLMGAAVSFNGIRVGEVTNLQLSAENPKQVFVTIAIDPATPLRTDTKARIDVQGLMGSPSVALEGGSPGLPVLKGVLGEPPLLIADASAGRDFTQAARQVLGRIDKILSDNSDQLHDAIANLDTFSSALSRNAGRVDGILAGLEKMTGGESKSPTQTFDLTAPRVLVPPSKKPGKQLVIADPTTLVANDTQRIILRASDGGTSFLDNGQWADSASKLLQAKIIQSFENANFLAAVGRPSDGLSNESQILIDLHRFEISVGPPAKAELEFMAKILTQNGKIADSKLFRAEAPVSAMDPASATRALNEAFIQGATELVQWTAQKL
ncbi:ABC-type transport auxiliary lipoprotein family protein [Methylocapsa aurea]|uniref:ABC-type transport auxiliary lipoprotein family protein n=1 Tax=Methylocapsa aurea TaxID=663610 RepID=UPI000569CFD2|nr:ABC-type transport auxiliary lipoprotein family protein [Methylocapsa aurea]